MLLNDFSDELLPRTDRNTTDRNTTDRTPDLTRNAQAATVNPILRSPFNRPKSLKPDRKPTSLRTKATLWALPTIMTGSVPRASAQRVALVRRLVGLRSGLGDLGRLKGDRRIGLAGVT